jgi:hypothetical protein
VTGFIFDPPTLHKYVYALNNPVNRIDPAGTFSLGELGTAVSIGGILSATALTHFTFAVIQVKIMDALIEPGLAFRYGSLQLIAATSNPEVLNWAFKLYEHGNTLIAVGSALTQTTADVLSFGQSFGGLVTTINGLATAGLRNLLSDPAGLARSAQLVSQLNGLNGQLGAIQSSLQGLANALGLDSSRLSVPNLSTSSTPLSQSSEIFFNLALSILLEVG